MHSHRAFTTVIADTAMGTAAVVIGATAGIDDAASAVRSLLTVTTWSGTA